MSDRPTYDELERKVRELERAASDWRKALEASLEKERHTRSLLDHTPVAIYRTAEDGRILEANQALAELLGFPDPRPLLHEDSARFLVRPEDRVKQRSILKRKGVLKGYVLQLRRRDGKTLWARDSSRYVQDPDGQACYEGILEDITRRKQQEREYLELFNGMNETAFVMGFDGRFRAVNEPAVRILGYSRDEFLSMGPEDIDPFLTPEKIQVLIMGMKTHERQVFETEHRAKDGKITQVEVSSSRVTYQGEESILSIVRDITNRKRAESALLESEQFRRRIIQSLASGLYIYNLRDARNDFITPQYTVITGWTLDELADMKGGFRRLFHPEDLPRVEKHFGRLMSAKDGEILEIEYRFRTRNGRWIWCVSRDTLFERDEDGDPLRFLGSFFDITKRKDAESERERLLSAMEQAAEVVVITDPDGAIQYVNPAFEHITGYSPEEAKGKNPRILKSGEQNEAFYRELWRTISSGKNWKGRLVNRRKDGSTYTEEASISPIVNTSGEITNYVAVKRDIRSEINLQAQLAHAQKMESIGTLAGGIAHDFNNILSAVMGYSEMARSELPVESYAGQCIEEVLTASHRAKALVKQILSFSRFSEEVMQPLRAALLLKEAVKLLRASLPSTIEIRTDISASRDTILANPTQIHQVIMNLCTNAYHAMRDTGGVLSVNLKELHLDEQAAAWSTNLTPGQYLMISIADTGHGMSPEVMERIFDPYFTTKEKDIGTGLGLSVVHGIVKRHGGDVHVRSEPGKGTTFEVLLSILEEEASVSTKAPVDMLKGSGRILFVDDEAPIANIGGQMLRRLGYDVEVAVDSSDALERFKSRPGDFDLVITDMTMPHLRGDDLAQAVMDVRPDMPVILCTGYSDMISIEKAAALGIRMILEKPIAMFEMAGAVHGILSSEGTISGDE